MTSSGTNWLPSTRPSHSCPLRPWQLHLVWSWEGIVKLQSKAQIHNSKMKTLLYNSHIEYITNAVNAEVIADRITVNHSHWHFNHSMRNHQCTKTNDKKMWGNVIYSGCWMYFKCSYVGHFPPFYFLFIWPAPFHAFFFSVLSNFAFLSLNKMTEFLSEALLSTVSIPQREIPCYLLNLSVMVCFSGSSAAALSQPALMWLDFISQPAEDKLYLHWPGLLRSSCLYGSVLTTHSSEHVDAVNRAYVN